MFYLVLLQNEEEEGDEELPKMFISQYAYFSIDQMRWFENYKHICNFGFWQNQNQGKNIIKNSNVIWLMQCLFGSLSPFLTLLTRIHNKTEWSSTPSETHFVLHVYRARKNAHCVVAVCFKYLLQYGSY